MIFNNIWPFGPSPWPGAKKMCLCTPHLCEQNTHQIWLVCFVALRPKSTAMVMAGWSVHLTTLLPGQAWPVLRAHTFACNWQPFLNYSAEGRRMTVEMISWSISMKVWDQAGIELATSGYAVRLASVARHVTDCATPPVQIWFDFFLWFRRR